jgi:murein DD-endopeptidase MepM/ murein hydrolase activator NlpD
VRYFPGAASRHVLASLALLATLGSAVPLAYAVDGDDGKQLKQKQRELQGQIEQSKLDVDASSAGVAQAQAALATAEAELSTAQDVLAAAQAHQSDVQTQLTAAQAQDATMQQQLGVAQANLDQARAAVVAGQAALDAQQKSVKDTVVGLYQQGPPQLLALNGYLNSESPSDLTRKMEYANTLVEDQSRAFGQLHDAQVALQGQRDAEKAAEQAATEQADLAAQQLAVVQDLQAQADGAAAEAQTAQDAVTATVAARTTAEHKAKRALKRDKEQLALEEQKADAIAVAIRQAALRDKTKGYVGSQDGILLAPVDGAVTSPFGYRIHPIYGYWGLHDGTDFGVSCGEGMRAAADGTVTQEYYSSVYGNRLYLDVGKINGKSITVVYNHATSYRLKVGDTVKRGAVVGYVGSTGWSTGCHLHFTVLQNGTAVDPMGYL